MFVLGLTPRLAELADTRATKSGSSSKKNTCRSASGGPAASERPPDDGSPLLVDVDLQSSAAPCRSPVGAQPQGQGKRDLRIRCDMACQSARFPLEPALMLGTGPLHTAAGRRYSARSAIPRPTAGDAR